MPLSGLAGANKVIGTKQVRKAISKGIATRVFIAEDAEPHIVRPLIDLCLESGIEVEKVPTMEELGKACGIEIGSASAAIIADTSAKGGA